MDAVRIPKVADVQIHRPGKGLLSKGTGILHLTAHHIIYTYTSPTGASTDAEQTPEEFWIPYPLISQLTRLPQTLQGLSPVAFRTRTFEAFTLFFTKDTDAIDVFDSVRECTVVASITQLYAFFFAPEMPISPDGQNGWELYNVKNEYMRMGVGVRTKAWRFTDINKDYSFAPTYPAMLVVPTRIGDATLTYAGKYRSKARIPALSYLHWSNYGSITRCSQPLVGIKQNRSIQDEKLVEAIFQSHLSVDSPLIQADPRSKSQKEEQGQPMIYGATCTNVIIDARPTANAMANVAQGGGSENMDYYKGGTGAGFGVTRKAYLGIDNIHVMRDALAKLVETLREADGPADLSTEGFVSADGVANTEGMGIVDRQALRRTGWLKHLSAIMQGMLIVVRTVHVASSHVLVHCSDGWDRTAQITALAQLCLDPYFRTIRGFMVLIEKEWLSFGHKFLDRCGHLSSDRFFVGGSSNLERELGDEGSGGAGAIIAGLRDRISNPARIREMAPVFHQFLECVRNIQRQYPDRFEYNELFLRKIYYHLMACEYGTFLFNCERERRVSLDGASSWSGIQKTKSVWEWFFCEEHTKDGKWLNPTYDKGLDDVKTGAGDMGVLLPSAKDVRFWSELYGRTDEDMNGKFVPAPPPPNPELKVVNEGAEDSVLIEGAAKGIQDLSLSTGSGVPSRNGTPTLSASVNSSTGAFSPAGSISRDTSPAILTVDNTPPSPKVMTATPGRLTSGQRADSFRPFTSSSSTFSLRSSPTPSSRVANTTRPASPPTSTPLTSSSPSAYSSLYERAPPPQQAHRQSVPNESNTGFGMTGLSPASLTDGLAGFASNAGGGMKSMWGMLSSNATAAFSAVQDATKDYRGAGSGTTASGGDVFTGYGGGTSGYSSSAARPGQSALGWSNDPWNAPTDSPASASVHSTSSWSAPTTSQSNTPAIRPKPRVGTMDTLSSNPWGTPATAPSTTKPRSLEEEWQSVTVSQPPTTQQAPLGGILIERGAPLAAPTPRHASSLSPNATSSATPQEAPEEKGSDPLGVGL